MHASLLECDISPANGGGNIFRTRRVMIVEIGKHAGHPQNTFKPPCTQFFVIGDAVEQVLSGSIRRSKLIRRLTFQMLVQAVLPTHFCRARTFAAFGQGFWGTPTTGKALWLGAKCVLTFTETASTHKTATVLM